MAACSTGRVNVTSMTDPLVKSIPGFNPEFKVDQPGGTIMEISPGRMIRAEIRKYQPRFPTMSSTANYLPRRLESSRPLFPQTDFFPA